MQPREEIQAAGAQPVGMPGRPSQDLRIKYIQENCKLQKELFYALIVVYQVGGDKEDKANIIGKTDKVNVCLFFITFLYNNCDGF